MQYHLRLIVQQNVVASLLASHSSCNLLCSSAASKEAKEEVDWMVAARIDPCGVYSLV